MFDELDDLEEEIAELDPQGRQLLTALATACDRVVLARNFYNDAARAARELRLAADRPPAAACRGCARRRPRSRSTTHRLRACPDWCVGPRSLVW